MTDKKTDLRSVFGSNKAKEEDGVWVEIAPGVRLRIRRANSDAAMEVLKRLRKPYGKMQKIPDHIAEQITHKYVAEGLISDWEGIVLNGEDLGPYNAEKAFKLVTDPEVGKDFREFVSGQSLAQDNFRIEDLKDAQGN